MRVYFFFPDEHENWRWRVPRFGLTAVPGETSKKAVRMILTTKTLYPPLQTLGGGGAAPKKKNQGGAIPKTPINKNPFFPHPPFFFPPPPLVRFYPPAQAPCCRPRSNAQPWCPHSPICSSQMQSAVPGRALLHFSAFSHEQAFNGAFCLLLPLRGTFP